MATCKDCIHYDLCKNSCGETDIYIPGINDPAFTSKTVEIDCSVFKDKSRFVELPCNVGDKLYYVIEDYDEEGSNSFVYETKVVYIGFDKDGFYMGIELPIGKFQRGRLKIGVNIFKTYEEAEKKLQEMRHENTD